ncbi:MAG: ArdC-like ssDNA-binding domain-containing protein [Candidatus Marsarchaeota archaeon]|nr:ArdC-like ssDNA-binding domain-containing protein [Candidatus Marsarchaeota archaeon]
MKESTSDYGKDPKVHEALDRVKVDFDNLIEELRAGHTDRFVSYLRFCSRFHRYSPYNKMLIWIQRPDAILLAGYRKWQELGYQVRKGEKGIQILAPVVVKRKEANEEGNDVEREVCVGFKDTFVFDASQLTTSVKEADLFGGLPDDAEKQHKLVARAIEEAGIIVIEEAMRDGYFGRATYAQMDPKAALSPVVYVREGLSSRLKTTTLIHEWAHHKIHLEPLAPAQRKDIPLPVREAQVEACAYIVASYLGVEPPMSADYILLYKNTAQTLVENMDIIQSTSHEMIRAIEAAAEDIRRG